MMKKIALFALAVWLCFALPFGYSLIMSLETTISNTGNLVTVGIETNGHTIDWGLISPGETKLCEIIVTNTGNKPVTLSMLTRNWDPISAESFLSLVWNYDGSVIAGQGWYVVTFSLTCALDIDPAITNFSFDIVITGTQQ